ncbi:MAG: prepilin-type N-terminal cleavage/methylation domain-containing protein [Candidatus Ozemobacteraceae bacterium]
MKQGFTLIEVMVATMIMSLMILGLLSYVQFGSELWRKGEQTITLNNNARALSEGISRDLTLATKVMIPPLGATSAKLIYTLPLATGTSFGTVDIIISKGTDNVLRRKATNITGVALITSGAETTNKIFKSRLEYALARDVATFVVTRVSTWSVIVDLGLESIKFGPETDEVNNPTDSVKLEASYTFLIPGVM